MKKKKPRKNYIVTNAVYYFVLMHTYWNTLKVIISLDQFVKIMNSALRNAGKNPKDVVYSSLEMIAGKNIGQKVKLNCKQLQI